MLEVHLYGNSHGEEGGNREGEVDLKGDYGNILRYIALKSKDWDAIHSVA